MLQISNDNSVREIPTTLIGINSNVSENLGNYGIGGGVGNCYPPTEYYVQPPLYWMNYSVYYCTDKTKKAIEVLKHLQNKKVITCNSVNKFIELVEEISNIL